MLSTTMDVSLPNCVWSSGSRLQYHTWDASCRLEPEPLFPCLPQPGTYRGTGDIALQREDHLVILGAAWCTLNGTVPRLLVTFSKQYFEKYGWGQRLKIKEQASVHILIYICSTWKGTVCYVDKNRQLLRGSVQLVSWAGSVVFVVELIHRQHGLHWDGFHTECQFVLQKFWHPAWS